MIARAAHTVGQNKAGLSAGVAALPVAANAVADARDAECLALAVGEP